VQALVFVNGWMPDEGESIQQLFEESEVFAGSLVPAAIRPVPFTNPDGSEGVDLYLDRELFPEAFVADVDHEAAKVMAATQRPWRAPGTPGPRACRGGVHPVVVPGGHRGPSHSAGGAAIHGRAWERTDRGGGGLARVHGVAAGGRDAADPERCGGDQPQPAVSGVTAAPSGGRPARGGAAVRRIELGRAAIDAYASMFLVVLRLERLGAGSAQNRGQLQYGPVHYGPVHYGPVHPDTPTTGAGAGQGHCGSGPAPSGWPARHGVGLPAARFRPQG
jgi:hypothetical protein